MGRLPAELGAVTARAPPRGGLGYRGVGRERARAARLPGGGADLRPTLLPLFRAQIPQLLALLLALLPELIEQGHDLRLLLVGELQLRLDFGHAQKVGPAAPSHPTSTETASLRHRAARQQ